MPIHLTMSWFLKQHSYLLLPVTTLDLSLFSEAARWFMVSLASWFSLAGSFLGGLVVDRPRMVSNPAPLSLDSLSKTLSLD